MGTFSQLAVFLTQLRYLRYVSGKFCAGALHDVLAAVAFTSQSHNCHYSKFSPDFRFLWGNGNGGLKLTP
jgi:hypothetical protein